MQKDRVILVHGVGAAKWYQRAIASLSPHFECIPINYEQYKTLGKLKVAFDPQLFTGGLIVGLVAIVFAFWHAVAAILMGSLAVLLIAGANIRAKYTRTKFAMDQFQEDLYKKTGGVEAHIVAHSFGSFLTGFVVREIHHVRCGKIILAGSVLPRDYDWASYRDRGPFADPKFQEVRNDVGSRDLLGLLVCVFRRLMPDLGDSGRRGFHTSACVHTIPNPSAECPTCQTGAPGTVHNISTGFFHSTAVTTGHIEMCWLPFLWDIPPHEYADVVNRCVELVRLKQHNPAQFLKKGQEFCDKWWSWTTVDGGRATVVSYLRIQIQARLTHFHGRGSGTPSVSHATPDHLTYLAVQRMWHLIAGGQAARRTGENPQRVKFLNPRLAAATAAKWAVESDRRRQQPL